MEGSSAGELVSLGAAAIATVIILNQVFAFITKMRANGKKTEENGFTTKHAACLEQIHYQVNEMHTGLNVSKDLQRTLSAIANMQHQQTQILQELTGLTAASLKILERTMKTEE